MVEFPVCIYLLRNCSEGQKDILSVLPVGWEAHQVLSSGDGRGAYQPSVRHLIEHAYKDGKDDHKGH